MTHHELIARVLDREGRTTTNDPRDPGKLTRNGLTYGTWRRRTAGGTVARFLALTDQQIEDFLVEVFIVEPGFDLVDDEHLREQLVDFGVMSDPKTAVRQLQTVLGDVAIDGVLGPRTLASLAGKETRTVRNEVAVARALFYARLAQSDINAWFSDGSPLDVAAFNFGWLRRALSFVE